MKGKTWRLTKFIIIDVVHLSALPIRKEAGMQQKREVAGW